MRDVSRVAPILAAGLVCHAAEASVQPKF